MLDRDDRSTIIILQDRARAASMIPRFWMELAIALEEDGRIDEAVDGWRMVLALLPASEPAQRAIERLVDDLHGADSVDTTAVDVGARHPRDPADVNLDEPNEPAETDRSVLDIDSLIDHLASGTPAGFDDGGQEEPGYPPESPGDEFEATETLAKIYESQNLTAEAAAIYDKLAERELDGERAEVLRARARDLRRAAS